MILSGVIVALAVFVLAVLVREFADADPTRAKVCSFRWHLWLLSGIAMACGMLARISAEFAPALLDDRIATILTLAGLAVRVAMNRRRRGDA